MITLSMAPEHNVTVTRDGSARNGPPDVDPEGVARLTFSCELPSCEVGTLFKEHRYSDIRTTHRGNSKTRYSSPSSELVFARQITAKSGLADPASSSFDGLQEAIGDVRLDSWAT